MLITVETWGSCCSKGGGLVLIIINIHITTTSPSHIPFPALLMHILIDYHYGRRNSYYCRRNYQIYGGILFSSPAAILLSKPNFSSVINRLPLSLRPPPKTSNR